MTRLAPVSHDVSRVVDDERTLRTSLMRATCVPRVLWVRLFAIGWLGATMPGSS